MTYDEALAYLNTLIDFERQPAQAFAAANFDLRRMEELLDRLGNPHRTARTVHIAGSKGKGSTAAMIAAALRAAGHRTGLYTSPHLHSPRERIQIDGVPIPADTFAETVVTVQPAVDAMNAEARWGRLTWFEVMTALAFLHFTQEDADIQVLEVGLGGRLDATNVVIPDVSVLTPISLDHSAILGDTISLIAREKAGIIKHGVPVVTAPQEEEALAVFAEVAAEREATLIQVGGDVRWERVSADRDGQNLMVWGRDGGYHLRIPLLGGHQLENAATAVAALEVLDEQGVSVSPEHILAGLSNVQWPGRLETLSQEPLIVVDGAHNPASARRLREAVQDHFAGRRTVLIVGVGSDKDVPGIAAELAPLPGEVIVTRAQHPRSASPETIAQAFRALGREPQTAATIGDALALATAMARPGDLILATGSLFVVAEVREHELGITPEG